jgi:hypothetical protein
MKNLLLYIISFTVLSSCMSTKYEDKLPKGETCLVLSDRAYCTNKKTNKKYFLQFNQMRGYECINMDFKGEWDKFIFDLLEEKEL